MKKKGGDWENEKRGAKETNIQEGDTVLKKNMIHRDKLTTTFDEQRFRVMKRNGPIVEIRNENTGESYERNVAHVKRLRMNEKRYKTKR